MSLYLCIFNDDEEVDGVDVGAYSDFSYFRKIIAEVLENGQAGSRFPTLLLHSDCEGEWSVVDCSKLQKELEIINAELKEYPPKAFFLNGSKKLQIRLGCGQKTFVNVSLMLTANH
jgi:hypothetical protein